MPSPSDTSTEVLSERVTVRLTPAERDALNTMANAVSLSPSGYLRDVVHRLAVAKRHLPADNQDPES